jgi:hypothetical protein
MASCGGWRSRADDQPQEQLAPVPRVQIIPLGTLTPADSVALLRKHRPDLPENDANLAAIAAELGCLPLALHWRGAIWRAIDTLPSVVR